MKEANKIINDIESELSLLIGKDQLERYRINQGKIYNYLTSL